MKRETAIAAFGGVAKLAAALGITRQAIYQWPDDLPQDQSDRVYGAAMRIGIQIEKVGAGDTAPETHQEAA